MSQVVKYVTRTYSSKPFAQIDDSACLREGCHSKRLVEALGIADAGDGVVRVSMVHYNTLDEVDRLIAALDRVL